MIIINLQEKALIFATKAHKGQFRKSTNDPYITHPIRVAETLKKAKGTDELIAAGFLHDVVEDTIYTIEDIAENFGKEVAFIVSAHTEDKSKSWEERKQHTITTVENASLEVKSLIVADKLDNLYSVKKSIEKNGDKAWMVFKRGYEKQSWYNTEIAKNMFKNISEESEIPNFFYDYKREVEKMFKEKR